MITDKKPTNDLTESELRESIIKIEKGLKSGNDIIIGGSKVNVFDTTLIVEKMKNDLKRRNRVHYSSTRLDWNTPKAFYKALDDEFKFNFDPCPNPRPKWDGLSIEWKERNFINPPYGREGPKWIKKAYDESLKGKLCVLLLPSRTDTRWWHDFVMKAKEIRFIKGRLHFDDCPNPASFPSCVVIMDGRTKKSNGMDIIDALINSYRFWSLTTLTLLMRSYVNPYYNIGDAIAGILSFFMWLITLTRKELQNDRKK